VARHVAVEKPDTWIIRNHGGVILMLVGLEIAMDNSCPVGGDEGFSDLFRDGRIPLACRGVGG